MRTRSERGQLLRSAEQDFTKLRDELINDEVAELAMNFHGILSIISSKYSNEAIIELVPELTALLNKLDAALKVNADLKDSLTDIYKENQQLTKALEAEKKIRRHNLEESLHFEESTEVEIISLKHTIEDLEKCQATLHEEIDAKNAIITMLRADLNSISNRKSLDLEKEFIPTKHCFKTKTHSTPQPTLQLENRFSVLSNDTFSIPPCKEIVTEALIHHEPTASLPASTPVNLRHAKVQHDHKKNKKIRSRVIVLADSQGKDMHKYIRDLEDEHDVFVYSVPGGKIKNILHLGLDLVKDFTAQDFIILLAGSNDVNHHEPAQLTVTQGIKQLLSMNQNTNIFVTQIPYRYDNQALNDRIFFCNQLISRLIDGYNGQLNIFFDDTNSILGRSHFTRHGLHYSRLGKRIIGQRFIDFVRNFGRQILPMQSSLPSILPRSAPKSTIHDPDAIETYPETTQVDPAADSPHIADWPILNDVDPLNCSSFYTNNFPPLPVPTSDNNSTFLEICSDPNRNNSI